MWIWGLRLLPDGLANEIIQESIVALVVVETRHLWIFQLLAADGIKPQHHMIASPYGRKVRKVPDQPFLIAQENIKTTGLDTNPVARVLCDMLG